MSLLIYCVFLLSMKTIFDLPEESKVWIYLSPRAFNADELALINKELKQFISTWESHGTALDGHYDIIDEQFIVFCVNETEQIATGCSIDKSVGIIKKLEPLLNLNLTDRGMIAWQEGTSIKTTPFQSIKQAVENNEIAADTIIYNNSITSVGELNASWKIQAKDSWLKRYFN